MQNYTPPTSVLIPLLLGKGSFSGSTSYGPTADTGGLMRHKAPVIYAYPDVETLIGEEAAARRKTPLPGPGLTPVTERPDRA